MRLVLSLAVLAALAGTTLMDAGKVQAAETEKCTGENCPPPQGSGGHECEREKKEETVS